MSRVLAAPWATQMLGDMGADVIKIEHPSTGDETRQWGPPFIRASDSDAALSAYFICCNRNKRSVAVDIKSPAGRAVVLDIAATCDVVVENFLPGKLASLGLGYEHMRAVKRDVIYASLTGFGQSGPLSNRAGYDLAIAAQTGLMSITGPADGPPVKVGVAVTDLAAGMYLHSAILAALLSRARTGAGQAIDVSMYDCQLANLANIASNALHAGPDAAAPRRWGTAHESIAPYQSFPAADGDIIIAAMNDRQFASLCDALQRDDLKTDARFASNALRVTHRQPLVQALCTTIRTASRSHWIHVLSRANVTVAPINTVVEALYAPHTVARDMVADVHVPALGRCVRVMAPPVKFSGSPSGVHRPPPLLGEHTAEVLCQLGRSEADVAALAASGVLFDGQRQRTVTLK